jgi:hypothetical protein
MIDDLRMQLWRQTREACITKGAQVMKLSKALSLTVLAWGVASVSQ